MQRHEGRKAGRQDETGSLSDVYLRCSCSPPIILSVCLELNSCPGFNHGLALLPVVILPYPDHGARKKILHRDTPQQGVGSILQNSCDTIPVCATLADTYVRPSCKMRRSAHISSKISDPDDLPHIQVRRNRVGNADVDFPIRAGAIMLYFRLPRGSRRSVFFSFLCVESIRSLYPSREFPTTRGSKDCWKRLVFFPAQLMSFIGQTVGAADPNLARHSSRVFHHLSRVLAIPRFLLYLPSR